MDIDKFESTWFERPVFLWYEKASICYLEVIEALYDWVYADADGKFLKNKLGTLCTYLEAEERAVIANGYIDRDFDIWGIVQENIEIKTTPSVYIYTDILRPFEPILRAYYGDESAKMVFVANVLQMSGFGMLYPNKEFEEEIFGIDLSVLGYDILSNIVHCPFCPFLLTFSSLLWTHCNLLGINLEEIADYYHIPLFPLLRFYNLLKIQGLGAHRRHKYYPEFDIRALSKPGGAAQIKTSATAIPPELGIPSQLLPILERGQKAGFLDDEYKPIPKSMTRPQQKRFALLACIEAGLDNYCNRFGKMWGCDYNGVDESRGAAQRRKAIDSLFAQAIINKAKLK